MGAKKSRDGLLKNGTSRRAKAGQRRGIPPILWVAIAVCAVGAFFLFRNPGGGSSGGIGERHSVVEVGADTVATAEAPRSGDVDITRETRDLTPEPAEGSEPPAEKQTAEPEKKLEPAPTPKPKPATKPAEPAAAVARIKPAANGGWVVQVGSFGDAANADREATRLRRLGIDARVTMGNLSNGTIAYRVRVAYFPSRTTAEAYARQEKAHMRGAIAVHR